jgi:GT2 family glycosyltransferase
MIAGVEPDETTRGARAPSILTIVVTHGGRSWLGECLTSLNAQTYGALDVLVVDDASSDSRTRPTLKRIAKRHLRRRRWGYLRTPRPLGFGGAINWALSRVRTDADLLLFVHDDVSLDRTAVAQMVHTLEADERAAIVGPKVVAWDDPQRLEEVGMAADRFGYPYKGLEEGEIDLGQHDETSESFYVTSTCLLVRHDVFRSLRGWDARLRAFAEDLDLCWRARVAGHSIKVEPKARVRHVMALATGQRSSPFSPARYFIRRNRLRTVFKNASTLRLLLLVPQFLLLTIAEMIAFIVLRQPREILALGRALAWNVIHLPQTLSERARVQRLRRISDLRLRRLTVKQSTRVRSYLGNQRTRMEEAWGRRADVVTVQVERVRRARSQTRGGLIALGVLVVVALILGFRNIWWGPQIAVGELLPYPERATALMRAFFSPWRSVGLGQPGPQPPALFILGIPPLVLLGTAGLAQKMLVLSLGVAAFVGAYRLVADLVDRPARVVAGAVYMLGSVGYAGVRAGSLGALVFGAAAPFVLRGLIQLAGWARPSDWRRGRSIAVLALGTAVSSAFVPGALFMYAVAGVVLLLVRMPFSPGERIGHGLAGTVVGLVVGWILLLPWSGEWFSESGPLSLMRSDEWWPTFTESFDGHGMVSVLTGQTPEGPVLFGLALSVLGIVAVVAGSEQRRRLALGLWGVIAATGVLVALTAGGSIRPFVASPTEAGVPVAISFAALAGLAVGGFRLDLPRREFGWAHGTTLAGFAVSVLLIVVGLGPPLLRGEWDPGRGSGGRDPSVTISNVRSVLRAEADKLGVFRTLWVGEAWTAPGPTAARPRARTFLTSPRGQVLSDLFESRAGRAEEQLRRVVSSIDQGSTDRGGALLGAFNIHFVVLDSEDPSTSAWLAQRDLALVRHEPDHLLLQHDTYLSRAGVFSEVPLYVQGVSAEDPGITTGPPEVPLDALSQRSSHHYRDSSVPSEGIVFLAEERDPGWTASLADRDLERIPGGWGNAFAMPGGTGSGRVEVTYPRSATSIAWWFAIGLAWIVVLGAAFSRRRGSERGWTL